MYISKIKIKNFKCFNDIEVEFDPNFNLIIGQNNSGKSTIFDALRLWQLAFQKFLKDRTNNKQSSFYAYQYSSFTIDDISFLRIQDFRNLYKKTYIKDFEISLTVSNGTMEVVLPIIFTRTTKDQVINFQLFKLTALRKDASKKLSEVLNIPLGSDFKETFLFTYINPIFLLPNEEPLFAKGYVLNKLRESKANEIIRNLLFTISPEQKKLKQDPKNNKLVDIENNLKEILDLDNISFSRRLEDEDSYIRIFSKNEHLNTEVEINQLGSGTINVLNILSVLAYGDYERFKLNALLLDEPDSHLHFNHQSRLYSHLKKVSEDTNKQIFIITHNSTLISQFDKVLFLENNKKEINTIPLDEYLENHLIKIDENHYNVMKKLSEAKKETDILNNQLDNLKNMNIPLVYTEGPSDVKILENAFNKLYPEIERPFNLINGSCANHLKNIFENDSTFEKNKQIQIAIFDFDSAYNQWNGSKNYILIENNPKKCLTKKHNHKNAFLILLPVPNIKIIQNQVLINETETFKHNSILEIEHLFSNNEKVKDWFYEEKAPGGSVLLFKGDKYKIEFSELTNNFEAKDFEHFIPLFEKICDLIGFTELSQLTNA
jgi:hypothetical protein